MAFSKDKEFKYSIRGINRVIEEKGSSFIALRQIAWGAGPEDEVDPEKVRLDLRKYRTDSEGNEVMSKGVSFMTEEGPNELVHVMMEEGYGDTGKCISILKDRGDFVEGVKKAYGENVDVDDDEAFDLRDLL